MTSPISGEGDALPQNLEIDFALEDPRWTTAHEQVICRAVAAGFRHECADVQAPVELSVLLTNDAAQQVLNREWRQMDKPTNVLSFPQIEPFAPPFGLIGDLSFAYETMAKEAQELDISLADHLSHLALHGFLHILGYDHLTDDEAERMESLETDILATLGIADPYSGDRTAGTV